MISGRSNDSINVLLSESISRNEFPSAVYLVYSTGKVEFADALGSSACSPQQHASNLETIYDLASLTKPLVTGLVSARLFELGLLRLDDAVSNWISEFDTQDKKNISIRHLVTHTSGLPAWRPLYFTAAADSEKVLFAVAKEGLQSNPGTHVVYSDLGFIVLGAVIERITGKNLAALAESEIFHPLSLEHTFFNPDKSLLASIAASETGNAYELSLCEPGDINQSSATRQGLIWGEVHDGNAYFLGGVAGHAGLFSTAEELMRIALQFIPSRTQLLSPETCSLFKTNLTVGLEEARSFAWQLAETKDSTAGPSLPADSFGHTGFTGTSCWINASLDLVLILLTNRTHNRHPPFANINAVRRKFHTLAMEELADIRSI